MKRLLGYLLLAVIVGTVAVLAVAATPVWKARRALQQVARTHPGKTTLEDFRRYSSDENLRCDGAGDCKYEFVAVNRLASRLRLAYPSSLSVEIWFEKGIAKHDQLLYMVGEEGQHAFVNVASSIDNPQCQSPCWVPTRSGIRVALESRTPLPERTKAYDLQPFCLAIPCATLESAYPYGSTLLERVRAGR